MTRAHLQRTGVGHDDLRIEAVAQAERTIDRRGFVIGLERFGHPIHGAERDGERVEQHRGLAVIVAG